MSSYTDTYEEQEERTDEKSMSFLEHLDELRTRLIRCAVFIFVAFAVCWAFSDKIYHFLEIPVRAAMIRAKHKGALPVPAPQTKLTDYPDGAEINFTFTADAKVGDVLILAGATTRLKVQRNSDGVVELVTTVPWLLNEQNVIPEGTPIPHQFYANDNLLLGPDSKLMVPTVQGAFNLYIKVAFYAAIFFAVPFLLVQAWGFVSPGLYAHEKRYAAPFIIMASVFFMLGCAFAYWLAFPRAADYLLGVAEEGNLRPLVSAHEYFDLIITIMLGLGIVFEIPTITFFLSRLGLISHHILVRFWRLAVVAILIVAALLSPTTDIPNLLVFAAPMLLLYGLSIGIAWVFHRKRESHA